MKLSLFFLYELWDFIDLRLILVGSSIKSKLMRKRKLMRKLNVPKLTVNFTVEEFAFANCCSIERCLIGSKIGKFETVCMLSLLWW